MRISEKKSHTLLVAPYGQSRETHLEISRMIWKLVKGVMAWYQAFRLKHQREKLRDSLSSYPDYLLKDFGLSPEEISVIKTRNIRLKSEQIAHSVRRN
ncbi:hypothetical protein K6Q96_23335 [Grimontia kaedaensis]|uniref:DUF1127 domain-containing protein n=1 Tax=Grimontia kaedaensis TaxID=2872157 RepID=A0ABY4X0A0_9GAMM|nr:hypothetical protein [Grimontia kaedaensis]USH04656.1 hypothetical protein K6Q96_23335 [Grimontia kaedaensis]